MNQYPPIPPLEARHVKELVRQIRVLRHDHPSFGPDELAAEWEDTQRWRIREHRPTPFAGWLDDAGWRSGFDRALAFAGVMDERLAKQRALRAKAKAWRQARKPGARP